MKGRLHSLALVVTLVAPACQDGTGPGQRVVGVIGYEYLATEYGIPTPDPVQLPDSVRAGVPFDVVVTTADGGGCLEAAGADAVVEKLLANVIPYDRRLDGCIDALVWHPRPVTLEFASPGDAVLVVQGKGGKTGWTVVDKKITVLAR